MRIILPAIIISMIFISCENDKNLDSLLDIGFDQNPGTEKSSSTSASKTPDTKKASVPKRFSSTSGTHYGIDISHFQGNIMDDFKPGDSLRFVICKATEGDYFEARGDII